VTVARCRALALAGATSLVAACATQAPRQVPAPPPLAANAPAATGAPTLPATPLPSIDDTTTTHAVADASPWQRLRDRFAMSGCDYRPQVVRWARRYTASPKHFAGSWDRALPFVAVVVDELERRNLPGEFAMLPFVESGYEPVVARGDRPAGMWQLMPDTARNEGLVVTADYDGRLDVNASTSAALSLIERYQKEFGDWRLADMAFNSGEYRVRALLGGRDAHSLSAAELGRLAFNPVTHDHLDRLLALSCVIAHPEAFAVTLPEPKPERRLKTVILQSGMDVRLAARLAGIDVEDMTRLNAAYRRHRMISGEPFELILPAANVERFQAAAETIPVAYWNDWREQRAARTSGIASWASETGVPVAVLAAANAIDEASTVTSSTRLLLPGHESEPDDARESPSNSAKSATHVVRSGDTLSSIAHRYKVPVGAIRKLNPSLDAKTLRPGDKVRVAAQ
jgi:membrane-bound lytic murein transglycosylase D